MASWLTMRDLPDVPAPGAERSYWLQEALAADAGAQCPPLRERIATDVCVIGGGFAGLWSAWELTERAPGMRIAIVESDICGGGASGRNGGFVSSSWHQLRECQAAYGEAEGLAYIRAIAEEIPAVGRWCEDQGVDAWFHHEGDLLVDVHGTGSERLESASETLRSAGEEGRIVVLDQGQVTAAVGARNRGGWLLPDGAIAQPARLARGLRRVLLERGVHIFENTTVTAIDADGGPATVTTGEGAVRADHVVLAAGAWASRFRPFRRSFAIAADHVVATEPIPERLAEIGWTNFMGLANARSWFHYLRPTEDGRAVIGGGAGTIIYGNRVSDAASHDHRSARVAAAGLIEMYPALEGVRFTHAWGGPMDMTATYTPFFQTVGNLHAALGFSGHGLTATKLGGRIIASQVLGVEDEWSTLPVVGPPVAKMPPEPARYLGARAIEWAMESGDRREARGKSRGRVRGVLSGASELPQRASKRFRRSDRNGN